MRIGAAASSLKNCSGLKGCVFSFSRLLSPRGEVRGGGRPGDHQFPAGSIDSQDMSFHQTPLPLIEMFVW